MSPIKQPPPDGAGTGDDAGETAADRTPRSKPKYSRKLDKAIEKVVKDVLDNQTVKAEYIQALNLAIKWEAVKARITGAGAAGSAFDDLNEEE